ncbi:WG repeat-containing protein [Anaeromicropila populeti]|uniref:WG containing repeat-containing protein n=1 Tax=Anaeromicropila populeti TaxID=37658 RepID=A0A1I6JQF2_9FIRM|nr:WG repeat-containing protein [Anaeromicropila populeti]SFR81183.1 WG containing repeat-containing protein [Anaeromicropila populeti]
MKRIIVFLVCLSMIMCVGCNNTSKKEEQVNGEVDSQQTEAAATEAAEFQGELYPIMVNGKMGYINANGEMMMEPVYAYAGEFCEGFAAVSMDDKSLFYINKKGENAFGTTFVSGNDFACGRAVVLNDAGKLQILDTEGNIMDTPEDLVYAVQYSEGFLCARFESGLYGFLDTEGKVVIDPTLEYARDFHEGVAAVGTTKDKIDLSYINTDGTVCFETELEYNNYMCVHDFSEGLACSYNGKAFGYISHSNEVIIDYQYESVKPFSEGLAAVMINGKWGFINTQGELIIDAIYDEADSFSEGLAAVRKKNTANQDYQIGFINTQGELVIDYLYDEDYNSDAFLQVNNAKKNGLIQVKSYEDKWYGYINDAGEVIYKAE